ncbi:DUF2939 domain-containing protein [Hydrogenophaga sp. 2FB]|uniref:DUF2939 domain-containing protein n=1 Tax=Hydrogenophaga sp. 2FB TaxID=2502187 RepID=UPI0010F9E8B1|nr:DUF2939 domain-containing protein [Hydrogenophaga sp. 2FB]
MKLKLITAAVAVAGAALAGYWYYSPYLAIDTMQAAAKAGDGETFNDHVDYPALRDSLKGQLMASITAKMQRGRDDSAFSAMGAMLGTALVNQMIDSFVRPEMVMTMLAQGRTTPVQPGVKPASSPADPAPVSDAPEKKWSLERISMNKVIASKGELADSEGGLSGLVFLRSGFSTWKLSEIRLPAEATSD